MAVEPQQDLDSDIAQIWNEAVQKYADTIGEEVKNLLNYDVSDITNREGAFNEYRHDGHMVDKLRSSLSRSTEFLTSIANIVGSAVSTVRISCYFDTAYDGTVLNTCYGRLSRRVRLSRRHSLLF